MTPEILTWINTVVLIAVTLAEIGIIAYSTMALARLVNQSRREAELHAERMAAMFEAIAVRMAR